MTGALYVCGTPIGNLDDVSPRLRSTLESVDLIYAEDTRRTAKLLNHLGISTPQRALFAGNEVSRSIELLTALEDGSNVALLSDAGLPGISDPGSEAVRRAHESGIDVIVVGGPSAVTMAVAGSGFGGGGFSFEGFLPRKGRDRSDRLSVIASETRPVVLFASPRRLHSDLADLRERCGGRREVYVARELTKLHEETWVGTLDSAVERWAGEVKGEVTLVLGPTEAEGPSLDQSIADAERAMEQGLSLSEAARSTASRTGVSRRDLYEALIERQTPS